jgi:hypothetical protein
MRSLDWDKNRRVTPVWTASQEPWPDAESTGQCAPRQEPRWIRREASVLRLSALLCPFGAENATSVSRRSASLYLLVFGTRSRSSRPPPPALSDNIGAESKIWAMGLSRLGRFCAARTNICAQACARRIGGAGRGQQVAKNACSGNCARCAFFGAKKMMKSAEKHAATIRANAKAARGQKTKRAKAAKQLHYLNRFFDEEMRVMCYYCREFQFWKVCRYKACRRARECMGDVNECLMGRLHTVSDQELKRAYRKLQRAMPPHLGSPEREVRMIWPENFWDKPENPLRTEIEIAERRRRRQRATQRYDDGLG